jgi:hypothetical protein
MRGLMICVLTSLTITTYGQDAKAPSMADTVIIDSIAVTSVTVDTVSTASAKKPSKDQSTSIDKEKWNLIFAILNALGSLATFGAFLFLFKRDKNKEKQIEQLSLIADTIKKQNELTTLQIDILRNSMLTTQNGEEALENMKQLKDIESQRLKLSVEPVFKLKTAGHAGYSGEFWLSLENVGETATIENIVYESQDVKIRPYDYPMTISTNNRLRIDGSTIGTKHVKDSEYKIRIIYKDRLNNSYSAFVTKDSQRTTLEIKSE